MNSRPVIQSVKIFVRTGLSGTDFIQTHPSDTVFQVSNTVQWVTRFRAYTIGWGAIRVRNNMRKTALVARYIVETKVIIHVKND
jgi:hypothetical protein